MVETLIEATKQVEAVGPDEPGIIEEEVGDKRHHRNASRADLKALRLRDYISEPDRGRRCRKRRPATRSMPTRAGFAP